MALMERFRKLVYWFRGWPAEPFMVRARPRYAIKNGDTIDIKVVCPRCEVYWSDATVEFGGPMTPACFRVHSEYKSTSRIQVDTPLACAACGHIYENLDIQNLIVNVLDDQKRDEVNKKNYRVFGSASDTQDHTSPR